MAELYGGDPVPQLPLTTPTSCDDNSPIQQLILRKVPIFKIEMGTFVKINAVEGLEVILTERAVAVRQ
jgi:hypothetical protein